MPQTNMLTEFQILIFAHKKNIFCEEVHEIKVGGV